MPTAFDKPLKKLTRWLGQAAHLARHRARLAGEEAEAVVLTSSALAALLAACHPARQAQASAPREAPPYLEAKTDSVVGRKELDRESAHLRCQESQSAPCR